MSIITRTVYSAEDKIQLYRWYLTQQSCLALTSCLVPHGFALCQTPSVKHNFVFLWIQKWWWTLFVWYSVFECSNVKQSKYWSSLLIWALLCPFWCHNQHFDYWTFRSRPCSLLNRIEKSFSVTGFFVDIRFQRAFRTQLRNKFKRTRKRHPAKDVGAAEKEGIPQYCPPVKKTALDVRASASTFRERYAAVPDEAERRRLIEESYAERRYLIVTSGTKLATTSQLYPFLFTKDGVSVEWKFWSQPPSDIGHFVPFHGTRARPPVDSTLIETELSKNQKTQKKTSVARHETKRLVSELKEIVHLQHGALKWKSSCGPCRKKKFGNESTYGWNRSTSKNIECFLQEIGP